MNKVDILYLTIQSIKKDKEKGECVRAFGKDSYAWASPVVIKWLRDPSIIVRNCAVVSLEEMKADGASQKLVDMFKKIDKKTIAKYWFRDFQIGYKIDGPASERRNISGLR